jgi:predicted NAD/FAD-binding protein
MPMKGKKVAVVGSGVAGLSTAYLLSREHTVTIFEREAAVGMDAHSLDAHGARMDIPLRVFSESYYPNLCSIYKHLGVKYRHADYSFSCRPAAAAASYFRYINFFVADMALPLPLCLNVRELFKCVRLAFQFAHFVNRAPAKLAAEAGELRLGTFLERHGHTIRSRSLPHVGVRGMPVEP